MDRVLAHLHNYFEVDKQKGRFAISDHSIVLPFLSSGQYFRIIGSIFNDGVYEYPCTSLKDESFDGEIWALAVPPAVIALSARIAQWEEDNGASPFASESFGGYSYSKATSDGVPIGWKTAFRSELNQWRKI